MMDDNLPPTTIETPLPPTAIEKQYTYQLHDKEFIDEYFWLRDQNWPKINEEILQYLRVENDYTDKKLLKKYSSDKEKIYQELKSKIELEHKSVPFQYENTDYQYHSEYQKDSEYPIFYRKKIIDNKIDYYHKNSNLELVIDFNKFDFNGGYTGAVSKNQQFIAYSLDLQGDEKYTIKVRNIVTQEDIDDIIEDIFGKIIWYQNGFFYTKLDQYYRPTKILYHKLNTDNTEDILIYEELDKEIFVSISKTNDYDYLLISLSKTDSTEIDYIDLNRGIKSKIITVRERVQDIKYSLQYHGGYFYLNINDKNNKFRIIRAKVQSNEQWEEYYSSQNIISGFSISNNFFMINEQDSDALPKLLIKKFTDSLLRTITLPMNICDAAVYANNFYTDDIRIAYSSLKDPSSTFSYNFEHDALILLKESFVRDFNSKEYQVERKYVVNDNVKVPLTIVYKKSLFKSDGSNPCIMHGYGAYGISQSIGFSRSNLYLLSRGFVITYAHIRGGGDLGEDWYLDGKLDKKMNTFNDFVKCTKYLINENYTKEDKIIAIGGSASGLLIGYLANNHSDLYKGLIGLVPFVDLINTIRDETLPLTPGEYSEWGNPTLDKKAFEYMLKYSPYDNIRSQNYTNLFFTAGLYDPRVTYWEPAKFIAKIRKLNLNKDAMILLKTEMNAGHAGSSKRFKSLEELSDICLFILKILSI